jgi:glycosyltransferase involved in cell wall biosynthesis
MRLLHLYSGNLFGGVERMLVALGKHGGGSAEHQFALCFDGSLAAQLRAAGAPVHLLGPVRLRNPVQVWRARRALRRVLARVKPDVVLGHAPWSLAVFGRATRASGARVALFMHEVNRGEHWQERLARRAEPDLLVANSAWTAAGSRGFLPGAQVQVVHPAVELSLPSVPGEREAARADLGVSENEVVIVLASRLERWKGHGLLLEALGKLNDLDGWRCFVAGGVQRAHERAYLDELQALAVGLGLGKRVRFLGQREDVPRLLRAADLHCQPNTGPEPFGVAFVEALAAQVPVVTVDHGGAQEIVDESCGVLVPPSVDALAEALRALILDADRRAALAAAGPARAEAVSCPARQAERLVQALGAPRGRG